MILQQAKQQLLTGSPCLEVTRWHLASKVMTAVCPCPRHDLRLLLFDMAEILAGNHYSCMHPLRLVPQTVAFQSHPLKVRQPSTLLLAAVVVMAHSCTIPMIPLSRSLSLNKTLALVPSHLQSAGIKGFHQAVLTCLLVCLHSAASAPRRHPRLVLLQSLRPLVVPRPMSQQTLCCSTDLLVLPSRLIHTILALLTGVPTLGISKTWTCLSQVGHLALLSSSLCEASLS